MNKNERNVRGERAISEELSVLIFDRVASMQETEYDFTLLKGPEPMTFSTFLLPPTWLVRGSGFSELTRPV